MKHIPFFLSALLLLVACNNATKTESNAAAVDSTGKQDSSDPYGWIGTETVKSRLGDFEFKNGYPAADAVKKLNDALVYSRAMEVYLGQNTFNIMV